MNTETKSPHTAKFTSRGGGASIKIGRGEITVWRGQTESGEDSVAVKMTHESGNQHEFLLTFNPERLNVTNRSANVSDQRPGDRDATKNTSSGIAGFAASDG